MTNTSSECDATDQAATGGSAPRRRTYAALRDVVRRRMSSPFITGVASLAGGAVVANLVSIAVTPICTRIYAPRDFGVYAQFAAITGILLPAASLGFEIAIPLEKEHERANWIARLCLLLVTAMAAFTGAMFIFGPHFAPRWVDASLVHYWWIAVITMAGSGYYQMATYLAIRSRSYRAMGKTTCQQAIGAAAVQVFGGLAVKGPSALLFSTAVASGLGAHRLLRACGSDVLLSRTEWNIRKLARTARNSWGIASGSLSSNTLNTLSAQAPTLMVSAAYGLKVCGLFLLASRLVSVTDRVITVAVARTYYGEAALRFAENPKSLRGLFLKTISSLTVVGVGGGLAIWFLAPIAMRLMLGGVWTDAGIYARYMAPRFVGTIICSPVSDTTFILGRRMSKSVLECLRLGSTAALFCFCQATNRPPTFAVLGYSLLHLLMSVVWLVALMSWTNQAARTLAADRPAAFPCPS
jgi:O-antigen/teichoic acid export membrane protein